MSAFKSQMFNPRKQLAVGCKYLKVSENEMQYSDQLLSTSDKPTLLQIFHCVSKRAASKHDRGCTCTVIFIQRPQLLHITTVGFHKAKARMNPPAKFTQKTESVWGGWEPTGMQQWLRMQCTAFYIYIYIYIIYTKQQ